MRNISKQFLMENKMDKERNVDAEYEDLIYRDKGIWPYSIGQCQYVRSGILSHIQAKESNYSFMMLAEDKSFLDQRQMTL